MTSSTKKTRTTNTAKSARARATTTAKPWPLEGVVLSNAASDYLAILDETFDVIERNILLAMGLVGGDLATRGDRNDNISEALERLQAARTALVYAARKPLEEAGIIAVVGEHAAKAVAS